MLRYLAGAASALLLVAVGFVIWTSRAEADKDRSGALNAAEFLTTKRVTKPKKCAC